MASAGIAVSVDAQASELPLARGARSLKEEQTWLQNYFRQMEAVLLANTV